MPKSESESWAILDFGWSYVTRNLKEKKRRKKKTQDIKLWRKKFSS